MITKARKAYPTETCEPFERVDGNTSLEVWRASTAAACGLWERLAKHSITVQHLGLDA